MAQEGKLDLTVETILELPLENLALAILQNYAESNGWNRYNWMMAAQTYLRRDERVPALEAHAEAWAWLESKMLVARTPDQTSADARIITRGGKRVLANGSILEIQAAERIGLDLQTRLEGKVRHIFLLEGVMNSSGYGKMGRWNAKDIRVM